MLDGMGNIIRQKQFQTTEAFYFNDMLHSADGASVLVFWNADDVTEDFDTSLVKIDSNGDLVWKKTYGGDGDDKCYSITETNTGDLALAGSSVNNADSADIWLLKLKSDGTISADCPPALDEEFDISISDYSFTTTNDTVGTIDTTLSTFDSNASPVDTDARYRTQCRD